MEFQRKTLLLSNHKALSLAKVIFRQYLEMLSLSVRNFLISFMFFCFSFFGFLLILTFEFAVGSLLNNNEQN